MIGKLTGLLAEKQPPNLLLDVNGVGYEIEAPMSTIYDLPHLGEKISLFIHLVIREDAHLLYGFLTRRERECFRQLIKISGVGPRIALAILSGMSPDELARAIQMEDTAAMARVPGIGKKTAERLILELRGKLGADLSDLPAGTIAAPASAQSDIISALMALGYNEREAVAAVKALPADVSVNDGIRQALKGLAKN